MSKLYRSHDQRARAIEVDLRERTVGPQRPHRPGGGFAGHQGTVPEAAGMSTFERREAESRAEAQRVVEEARRQAEAIQREAYEAGFAEGERAGLKLTEQKTEQILQTFNGLIAAVQQDRAALAEQHEYDLIKIAFLIATRVVHDAIMMEPERVRRVVRAALGKLPERQAVTLRLNPADRGLVEQQLATLAGAPDRVTIEADQTVGRGGCHVLSDEGDIDATIETQLRMLRALMWEAPESVADDVDAMEETEDGQGIVQPEPPIEPPDDII